ncbi:MAG: PAS domain S-box protein [Leptolyngbyaceae cyanobacterium SM2_5_2]|nr:PAS domain S-box protein [Leptolyngbyaceae cyanobacterium SM2_5_2]
MPESHFLGEIQRQQRQALLLWLLSLGGALGLGGLAAKLLLNRLAQFNQASRLLAEGDLTQRLATDSPIAELNGLARSFNQMADQLQAAFDQLQSALDESEAKFTSIFRFNPDPIAITSYAEGRFLDVNRSELDFFGYHRDEMIGRTALELNLWTDLDQRQHYRTLLEREGRVRGLEIQVTNKAGEIRTILFSAKRQLLEGQDCIIGAHQDITELKQTEAKLRQNQQWLHQYSQLSPGNIYTLVSEPDGSMWFEYVSTAVETIHEITVEQALADASLILNTFHPDDLPGYEAAAQACLQTLCSFNHQFRIITPSGRTKWLDVRSQPEVRPNGVVAWHGIAIDITERIQAAEALRASEERFRQLAETVKEGFFIYEMETDHYPYVNLASSEILGLTLEQIQSGVSVWLERIHPDDRDRIWAAVERERQGENFDQEYRYITPKGELRWLRSQAFPLGDATGRVVRVVGTIENITERKLTEAALHQSEAQKRAILNALPDLIIRMHRDGTYLDIQPTAAFPTELPNFKIGANIRQVLPSTVLAMYLDAVEAALQSGMAQVCEYPIWVQGQQLWQEVRIVPLLADEVLFVIRDLTGRHRIELALRQSRQQLAMAQRVAQVGYWEFDLTSRKVTWSKTTFNHWGFDPTQPEPSYEEFLQRVHPDDRPHLETIVGNAITNGTPYQIDLRALHPNGDIRYLDARGEALYNGQGQVAKLVGASTDITERKRTEDALRESEERFRRAFDDAPHGISLVLADGQFVKANAYFCNLLGYTEAELLNLTFVDVTYIEDRESDWRFFQEMMAGKIPTCQFEKRYVSKHGPLFRCSLAPCPFTTRPVPRSTPLAMSKTFVSGWPSTG